MATIIVMVAMVVMPKTAVTPTTHHTSARAAGYINTGINSSHGPNRKIVNKIHGVSVDVSIPMDRDFGTTYLNVSTF